MIVGVNSTWVRYSAATLGEAIEFFKGTLRSTGRPVFSGIENDGRMEGSSARVFVLGCVQISAYTKSVGGLFSF